mmetsp:Transcript_18300/g.55072  ORF Transcript_18300/g.55072 Transcript_18300/m.55072 type:complete len:331 (+) Transcript_18300:389-1381(+)
MPSSSSLLASLCSRWSHLDNSAAAAALAAGLGSTLSKYGRAHWSQMLSSKLEAASRGATSLTMWSSTGAADAAGAAPVACSTTSRSTLVMTASSMVTGGWALAPLMAAACRSSSPLWAVATTDLTSGSATLLLAMSSTGSSRGRNTSASAGLYTTLTMLSMMTAVLRTMGVFSLSPFTNKGTRMDRHGDSTAWTKVIAPSLWMASATSAGRAEQLIRVGTKGSTSRLPTTLQHAVIASTAAVLTCCLASYMHSEIVGTMVGSCAASWGGAHLASSVSSFRLPTFTCQLRRPSKPEYSAGSTSRVLHGLSISMNASPACSARLRTLGALSA